MIKYHKLCKLLIFLFFILEIVLLIGLSLVNYNAAFALLIGIILGWLLLFLLFLKNNYQYFKRYLLRKNKYFSKINKFLLIVVTFLGTWSLILITNIRLPSNFFSTVISDEYHIKIEHFDQKLTDFEVVEELSFSKNQLNPSIKDVRNQNKKNNSTSDEKNVSNNILNESYSDAQGYKFKLIVFLVDLQLKN